MSCGGGKCMRKGPITSNGYLNFLREYRSKCCGMSPVQTVKCGAKAWNRLTCRQKKKYQQMACKRPKRRRRRGCRKSRPRRRSCGTKRRRRKSRGCGCKKKKRRRSKRSGCGRRKRSKHCMKPGPVTNNGYLNFLRYFRRKHCGLKPNEAIRLGARKWCALPQNKKDRFRRMACKVTTSKRRKRSRLCRRC